MKYLLVLLIGLELLLPSPMMAIGLNDVLSVIDEEIPSSAVQVEKQSSTDKIIAIMLKVIEVILFAAGIAAVVMIVIAGGKLTFSAGNDEMKTTGKNTILYATLGLLAVMLAYLVVENVIKLFE